MRKMILGGAAALALIAAAAPALAEVPESTDPIKIANMDWTSAVLNTKIMEVILKQYGYNVEVVNADYLASVSAGIPTGDLTLGLEYWDTTAGEAMAEADQTGTVERLGALGPKATEDWWYPLYMKEKGPGLPDWKALNDCAEAFSVPETAPKGRYLGGPVTWGGFDDERVEALGLNYEVVHAGTDANMFAELESAYQRKAPILLWIYSPHWAPAKYEGEWVEFPTHDPACYTDPAWGMNKDLAYDFIDITMKKGIQNTLGNNGGVPVAADEAGVTDAKSKELIKNFTTLTGKNALAYYPDWPVAGFYDTFVAQTQKLINGSATPDKVLADLQKAYDSGLPK